MPGDGVEAGLAVRAVQREHLQRRREALRFHPPVGHQRRGGDDQARPVAAAVPLLGENVRERLHRLAEAHVVGKHAAEPRLAEETQPGIPLALIRPERRGEAFRSGVFAERPRLSQPLPENAQCLAARPGNPGAGDQLFQSSEFGGAAAAEAELFPIHCEVHPEQLVQRREDRFQPRVRQRQQPTVVEGDEQGLSIAVFEVEEVTVGIVGRGLQEIDDLRQDVDPLAVDRDADVELEPVDAAAFVQDRIDVAVGLGERRRETWLDLDPPAFRAQPGCHLDEEARPGHGIVVGKDEVAAGVRRKRVGVVRRTAASLASAAASRLRCWFSSERSRSMANRRPSLANSGGRADRGPATRSVRRRRRGVRPEDPGAPRVPPRRAVVAKKAGLSVRRASCRTGVGGPAMTSGAAVLPGAVRCGRVVFRRACREAPPPVAARPWGPASASPQPAAERRFAADRMRPLRRRHTREGSGRRRCHRPRPRRRASERRRPASSSRCAPRRGTPGAITGPSSDRQRQRPVARTRSSTSAPVSPDSE